MVHEARRGVDMQISVRVANILAKKYTTNAELFGRVIFDLLTNFTREIAYMGVVDVL